jgi:hypothetical protein
MQNGRRRPDVNQFRNRIVLQDERSTIDDDGGWRLMAHDSYLSWQQPRSFGVREAPEQHSAITA